MAVSGSVVVPGDSVQVPGDGQQAKPVAVWEQVEHIEFVTVDKNGGQVASLERQGSTVNRVQYGLEDGTGTVALQHSMPVPTLSDAGNQTRQELLSRAERERLSRTEVKESDKKRGRSTSKTVTTSMPTYRQYTDLVLRAGTMLCAVGVARLSGNNAFLHGGHPQAYVGSQDILTRIANAESSADSWIYASKVFGGFAVASLAVGLYIRWTAPAEEDGEDDPSQS